MYAQRRPGIICISSLSPLEQFLDKGVAGALPVSDGLRRQCRSVAAAELENIAALMEAEPMGLQFGLLLATEPSGTYKILRSRDRANLVVNPFRPDASPAATAGVAMITGADEAVAAHQRVAELQWRESVKGGSAAARVRQLLGRNRAA
jgi:hypothetical protein